MRHPIFARVMARLAPRFELAGGADCRRETLAGLAGRVVEVGAGSGVNFAYYPPEVTEVVAVEPEPYFRRLAAEAAARAPVPVTVVDGVAERLPLDDASCDAGVTALVLCSVADVRRALEEIRRVVRPGGELRFYEHVRAEDPTLARRQDRADRWWWPRVAGGCHCGRDTAAAIAAAGLEIERCRRFDFPAGGFLFAELTAPTIIGLARRPAQPD